MEKTKLQIYAENEFKLLIKQQETLTENERLCVDVKNYQRAFELISEAFSKEGASGGSAPYQIATLLNLLRDYLSWHPLTPITFEDDQFNDVEGELKQHKRAFQIFKDENGVVFNSRGIVFNDVENNHNFNGGVKCGDSILTSRLRIEKDVLTPKELRPIVINVKKENDGYEVVDTDEKLIEFVIKNHYISHA